MAGREITLLMIDGRELTVKLHLLPRLLVHRYSLITVLLSFTAMFILEPYEYISKTPSWFSAPFLLATIFAMLVLTTGFLIFTGTYLGFRRIITLPSTFASTVILLFATDYLLAILVDDPLMPWFAFILKLIFSNIFGEVVFFLAFGVIYEKMAAEYDALSDTAEKTSPVPEVVPDVSRRLIDVGSSKIELSDVMYLEAQQSYVNIVSRSRSYLIRKKFSDCLSEIPDNLGKQIHRSYWVNREYVSDFQRINQYRFQIVLKNGTILPVSRTRSTEIEKWFREL